MSGRALRVLHAVGKMDRGGIETWLMNLLRRTDRRDVAFDFLVETAKPGAYDEEIRDLGARIVHVERSRRLWRYGPALGRAIGANGPYDVVHSHVHLFGGFVLRVAAAQSVPVRVAHSHTALSGAAARPDAVRRVYRYRIIMRRAPLTLDDGQAWRVPRLLNVAAMQSAADRLIGQHDFTTFRDSQCQAKSPVKTLDRCDVVKTSESELVVICEARSFLHRQVRSMVGTLVEVGLGKMSADDVAEALAAQDRARCGPVAPPDGLYLMRVDY